MAQVSHRAIPDLGAPIVPTERQGVRLEVLRMERLDRLGDAAMDQPSPRRQDPGVGGVPDPVVREIEPLADAVQDATTHELFDGGGRVLLGRARSGHDEPR